MTGDWRIGLNKVKQDSTFWVPLRCRNVVDPLNKGANCLEVFFLKFSEENHTEISFCSSSNNWELGKATPNNDFFILKLLKEIFYLLKIIICSSWGVYVNCSNVIQGHSSLQPPGLADQSLHHHPSYDLGLTSLSPSSLSTSQASEYLMHACLWSISQA